MAGANFSPANKFGLQQHVRNSEYCPLSREIVQIKEEKASQTFKIASQPQQVTSSRKEDAKSASTVIHHWNGGDDEASEGFRKESRTEKVRLWHPGVCGATSEEGRIR